jgi:hypothetical protein
MNDDVIEYIRRLEQRVATLESELQSRVHAEETQQLEEKRQGHLRELTGPLFGAAAAYEEGRRMRSRP